MPRPPRFTYAKALHHVALRCNNREFLSGDPWYSRFEQLLQEARGKFPIRLHHYCLMTGRGATGAPSSNRRATSSVAWPTSTSTRCERTWLAPPSTIAGADTGDVYCILPAPSGKKKRQSPGSHAPVARRD